MLLEIVITLVETCLLVRGKLVNHKMCVYLDFLHNRDQKSKRKQQFWRKWCLSSFHVDEKNIYLFFPRKS